MSDFTLFKRGKRVREEFEKSKKLSIDAPEAPEATKELDTIKSPESDEKKLNPSEGKIYYVKFRLKNGKMSTARSTGQTNKKAAEDWARAELEKMGGGFIPVSKTKILFKDYAKDFFIKEQRYFKDTGCSWRQCLEKNRQLNEFIIPFFGDILLSEIQKNDIDEFRRNLQDKYSGSTINKILNNLRAVFVYAEDEKIISNIPKIQRPPKTATRPEKSILSIDDTRALFSVQWPNYRAYVANMTAAVTGMRRGELLALRIIDFDVDNKILNICGSYDEIMKERRPTTKNKDVRYMTIPEIVVFHLLQLIDQNPYNKKDSYIFYNTKKENEPIRGEVLSDNFIKALKKIGYTDEIIKEKNYTFHGWRAFCNTYFSMKGASTSERMKYLGWGDVKMAEKVYARPEINNIRLIQETMFEQGTPEPIPVKLIESPNNIKH